MLVKSTLAVLRAYKLWLSPMLAPSCRYQPTCSDYAAEAIARHGVVVGGALASWRIVRCNPLSRGGLDLVPERVCSHPSFIPGQRN